MKELADSIYEVVKDYRNHDNVYITPEKILQWGGQFGTDSKLILTELNNILPQVYISREKAKEYVKSNLDKYYKMFNYSSIIQFLMDTEFMDVQQPHKSQPAILKLIDEVLNEQYSLSYLDYLTFPKKHYIYFDDILASGSTIGKHLIEFLEKEDTKNKKNTNKILENEITLSVCVFCVHRWGLSFQEFRINKTCNEKLGKKINWSWNYEIQNHGKFSDQKLNIAIPVKGNNPKINSYLQSLTATKYI